MVERQPTLPRLWRQRGQALVKSFPVAQSLQTCGLAFPKCLVEVVQATVTNVVHDIHVHARHRIVEDEITESGQREVMIIKTKQPNSQTRLHQDFSAVAGYR